MQEENVQQPQLGFVEKAKAWAESETGTKVLKVLAAITGALLVTDAIGATNIVPDLFDEPFIGGDEEAGE